MIFKNKSELFYAFFTANDILFTKLLRLFVHVFF